MVTGKGVKHDMDALTLWPVDGRSGDEGEEEKEVKIILRRVQGSLTLGIIRCIS